MFPSFLFSTSKSCFAPRHCIHGMTPALYCSFLCPSERAQFCSYHQWFRRPAHVSRHAFVPACLHHSFAGAPSVLNGYAWPNHRPWASPWVARPLRHCNMCGTAAIGDEHQFIFMCPSLAPARLQVPRLLASGPRSLRLFLWQPCSKMA